MEGADETRQASENVSVTATGEISAQVKDVQHVARLVINALDQVTGKVNTVTDTAAAVALAVTEQEATAREISRAVDAASARVQDSTDLVMDTASDAKHIKTLSVTVDTIAESSAQAVNELEGRLWVSIGDAVGDRRKHLRVPVEGVARVNGRTCRIVYISAGGIALHCDTAYAAGADLRVDVTRLGMTRQARVVLPVTVLSCVWNSSNPATPSGACKRLSCRSMGAM